MPSAGDIIYASDIALLVPAIYAKASSTARTSTTTYADDAELAGIALAVGVYEIELVGLFIQVTTTTQKIKTNWGFTGTWNNPIRACFGPGSSQTADRANVTEINTAGYAASGQDAIYNTSTGTGWTAFREVARNVTITGAGNLSLQWAQSVSSTNATTLEPGTSFSIRRIS